MCLQKKEGKLQLLIPSMYSMSFASTEGYTKLWYFPQFRQNQKYFLPVFKRNTLHCVTFRFRQTVKAERMQPPLFFQGGFSLIKSSPFCLPYLVLAAWITWTYIVEETSTVPELPAVTQWVSKSSALVASAFSDRARHRLALHSSLDGPTNL